ncbi:HAD-IA family hydrolase [bacterium]|nr:HAD-IA family hydrolase [bacterium]
MIKIELLIFDLDGTLVDSLKDIAQSVNFTLQQLEIQSLPEKQIQSYVGDGISLLLSRCLQTQCEPNESLLKEALGIYEKHHMDHCLDYSKLYPDVEAVLSHFQNKNKIIISNKPENFTKKVVQGLGIAHYFDIILGGDSLQEKKPSPFPVLFALNKLRKAPRSAVMIGDGHQDIACGKAAGIWTCGVTYGFRSKDAVADADFIVDQLNKIKSIFN